MEHKEIASLVKRASKGNQEAFETLYKELFDHFYYAALKTVRCPEDAADIVQETMIELYRNLGKLKNPRAFLSYVNRMIYGKSVDLLRAQQKWNLTDDLEWLEEETSDDFLPETYLDFQETREIVMNAIDSLSANLRVIVLMYYYEQLSLSEIGLILGLQTSAVGMRLSRARSILKKKLTASEDFEDRKRKKRVTGVPVFILTKILYSDAQLHQVPEIKARVWENMCQTLGLSETGSASSGSSAGGTTLSAGAGLAIAATALTVVLGASALFVHMNSDPGGGTVMLPQGSDHTPPAVSMQPSPDVSALTPDGEVGPSPLESPFDSGGDGNQNGNDNDIVEIGDETINIGDDTVNVIDDPLNLLPGVGNGASPSPSPSAPNSAPASPSPAPTSPVAPPTASDGASVTPAPSPSPSPAEPIPASKASFTLQRNSLIYPAGTALTAEQILKDAGAQAINSTAGLSVLALDEVDALMPGEYYIYVVLGDAEIEGDRQKVITVVISEGEVSSVA